MNDAQVTVLDIGGGQEGHRAEYFALLKRTIGGERMLFNWRNVLRRRPVLVTQIEDSLPKYALICLVRSLMGQRTAGFLFRPLPAVQENSARMVLKRSLLRLVRSLPGVCTLTIMPFSVEPRFAKVANDWIYDPQFWDLFYPDETLAGEGPGPLADELRRKAGERRVCCAVGRQDIHKGYDQFVDVYTGQPALRDAFLFAFGGKVDGALAERTQQFEAAGGMALARFISAGELLDLYASADLIWCSYAAEYDQASGVFGRAMQLGIPVVVRKGSLIHRYCQMETLPHIAFDGGADVAAFLDPPARQDAGLAARRAREQGEASIARLRSHLGLAPA